MSMEARREWFSHYGESGRHRLMVALLGDQVAGFASSSRFRPKPGYLTSVETSVYLASDAIGKGIGSRLYGELFKSLEGEDLHRAYAGIALPNPASAALHERFGFKKVAHFTEQGPQVRPLLGRRLVREGAEPRLTLRPIPFGALPLPRLPPPAADTPTMGEFRSDSRGGTTLPVKAAGSRRIYPTSYTPFGICLRPSLSRNS